MRLVREYRERRQELARPRPMVFLHFKSRIKRKKRESNKKENKQNGKKAGRGRSKPELLCEQITNITNVLSTDLTTWMSLMMLAKFKVFSPSFNSRSNHPYIPYFLFRPQNIFLEKVVSEIAKTNIKIKLYTIIKMDTRRRSNNKSTSLSLLQILILQLYKEDKASPPPSFF